MDAYLSGVDTALAMLPKDGLDGKVRSILLESRDGGRLTPGLAVALARAVGVQAPRGDFLPLAYYGNPNRATPPFPTYPAQAIALMPDAWFAGKIVLIGADLTLQDNHLTPFDIGFTRGAGMPGVLIHAHGLAQILDGRRSQRLNRWQEGFVILLFAAFGVILAFADLGPGIKAAAAPLIPVTGWIAGFALFEHGGPNIPLVIPTLAFAGALGVGIATQWRKERAQRRFIREAFSKFLAPTIIKQLEADPSRLRLTGENRMMTFLFTDIADFTALMEQRDLTTVVPILNDYLDLACGIVLRHGGTIDKIVGDALVVFFNAPLDQPDHANRAVACALELDAFSRGHRARHAALGTNFGRTRIGVNTGVAVVGNFGGNLRFDYTAHGDAINTGSRLEAANKVLGTSICVGSTTVEGCTKFQFRPVGELLLKGKAEFVEVFEPVTAAEAAGPKTESYLAAYQRMKREGDGAAGAFEELAARYPDDPLIALHARRLAASAVERRQDLKASGCTIIIGET
jgi:class 3 adenylate cyclase